MIPANFQYPIKGNPLAFDIYGSQDVAAGATVELVTMQNDRQGKGWITLFGHGIDVPTAFSTSVWAILVDGVPVASYNNIRDQLGLFSDPRIIIPTPFRPGGKIAVRVINNGASTFKHAARLMGFVDVGNLSI